MEFFKRILWRKYTDGIEIDALDKILKKTIELKMVPIVELHDATGSNDPVRLLEMAYWWCDNIKIIMKYRKFLIVNIVNEWR